MVPMTVSESCSKMQHASQDKRAASEAKRAGACTYCPASDSPRGFVAQQLSDQTHTTPRKRAENGYHSFSSCIVQHQRELSSRGFLIYN